MFLLVLLQMEVDVVTKERSCKKNMGGAFSSGGSKVILTLLTEVIIFYIRLIMIHVR